MRRRRPTDRSRLNRRACLVVGGLGAVVVGTQVVVVLVGGALIGQIESPSLALSVLATAVVALGFDPVQARLEHAATHLDHGGTP